MAYDGDLVERVRACIAAIAGVNELKMFGGWGVTIHGNMAVGVMGDDLIVRVGKPAFEEALKRPGARPFDFTGRAMTAWVYVDAGAIDKTRDLDGWITRGVAFAESLPRKSETQKRRRARTTRS